MTALFQDMINKEMEVYVNDMIFKSRMIEGHFEDLKKLFDKLEKFKLRLNPQKCVFGATGGKLLGFIISEDGIRVDETKTKAIIEMPPPKTEKEIREYANQIHAPASELYNLTSPWPFSIWGLDIIGKVSPKASNGHEYILVAVDYFTIWIEATSFTTIIASHVVKFMKNNIISRYGIPHAIITDNGTPFVNKRMVDFLDKFKIQHHRSSPYRPQMNGGVEAANKTIIRILERIVKTYRDWSEMLPYALWAYQTSVRSAIGATPYELVYGMKAVLPVEIKIPSLRIQLESEVEEGEWQ
ncbi:uncharacterized protein LOC131248475 [Magnolia sinica]|uniref:uncharacterized protein LOC131248475 n=1 Tax=Magnolia sinica TaxID=86752 RepID=UPI00265931F7|nr:uncharacterized protein LOC131248475 [Magnolia sinica]